MAPKAQQIVEVVEAVGGAEEEDCVSVRSNVSETAGAVGDETVGVPDAVEADEDDDEEIVVKDDTGGDGKEAVEEVDDAGKEKTKDTSHGEGLDQVQPGIEEGAKAGFVQDVESLVAAKCESSGESCVLTPEKLEARVTRLLSPKNSNPEDPPRKKIKPEELSAVPQAEENIASPDKVKGNRVVQRNGSDPEAPPKKKNHCADEQQSTVAVASAGCVVGQTSEQARSHLLTKLREKVQECVAAEDFDGAASYQKSLALIENMNGAVLQATGRDSRDVVEKKMSMAVQLELLVQKEDLMGAASLKKKIDDMEAERDRMVARKDFKSAAVLQEQLEGRVGDLTSCASVSAFVGSCLQPTVQAVLPVQGGQEVCKTAQSLLGKDSTGASDGKADVQFEA